MPGEDDGNTHTLTPNSIAIVNLLCPRVSHTVQETSSSSEPLEKEVTLKNVSPLHLTPLLETSFPFYLSGCHGARSHVQVGIESNVLFAPSAVFAHCKHIGDLISVSVCTYVCLSVWGQELSLDCGAEAQVKVTFDPSYCSDKLSRREEKELTIAFKEHSHKVRLCRCTGCALVHLEP